MPVVVGWAGWQLAGYFIVAVVVSLRDVSYVTAPLVVGEGWRCLHLPY